MQSALLKYDKVFYMNDTTFIFATIFVTTGLTYLLYKILLTSEQNQEDAELQITSDELIAQLMLLQKQKKYSIVQSLAKNYLDKKKSNDDVRRFYARSLYESKKLYEAIEQAKIVLKHLPKDIEIRIFLSNCYEDVKKPQDAIRSLSDILDIDSNNFLAIKNLARIYLGNNQKISAMKMYKRLDEFLENNQERVKNKTIVAEIHSDLREYNAAIDTYLEILEIYPDDIIAKKRLVELYLQVDDAVSLIELATEIYQEAKRDEDVIWAMKKLSDYYFKAGDYEKALEYAYLISENAAADKIDIGKDIAQILIKTEKLDDGIELLLSLIEQEPENTQLKKDLATAYEQKLNFESAVSLYKTLIDEADLRDIQQLNSELSNIYSNWAMHLFEAGDNERCFKKFIIALQHYSQNPDIYFKLGNVNKSIKNFNEAISQYKKALELDPTNVEYYYSTAECYEAIDSIYDQKRSLLDSLNYSTTNAQVHYKLGIIHQIQGDLASAIASMRKTLELDKNHTEAMLKLALMQENKGNRDEAIMLYESILKINPEDKIILNNLKMLKG